MAEVIAATPTNTLCPGCTTKVGSDSGRTHLTKEEGGQVKHKYVCNNCLEFYLSTGWVRA